MKTNIIVVILLMAVGFVSCTNHTNHTASNFTCYGLVFNDSSVCNYQNGTCVGQDNCTCFDGYGGDECEDWECGGRDYGDQDVCTGHGWCVAPENCTCYSSNYTDTFCGEWYCYGLDRRNVISVCSGHGTCLDIDFCDCLDNNYDGDNCEIWTCYGTNNYDVDNVCSSHGTCYDHDFCRCAIGYSGDECESWDCGGLAKSHPDVCNSHGTCIGNQECSCIGGYEGIYCEDFSCLYDCSGNGECVAPDDCNCNGGFTGEACDYNVLYASVMMPILMIFSAFATCFLCLLCCIFCVVCLTTFFVGSGLLGLTVVVVFRQYLGMTKFRKLKNFDILLKEQELEEEEGIAHLRINRGLFEVEYEEITIQEIIGEGGSNSRVFKAQWKGRLVAFKSFKTRFVCHNQEKYDEFEREVQILASLSHPNVVRFFGASLKPPRVGILMEFCSNGELYDYLKKHKKENGASYPILEKIRLALEIGSSMNYLHSRQIIHRDLKCENVLVDDQDCTKLMDFGLSRTVDRLSVKKTVRIGTNNYMAPEVVTTGLYTTKCDVFSYGIMLWVIFCDDDVPYGSFSFQLEFKVANDPNFRPNLDKLRDNLGTHYQWLESVITICWSHEPDHRFTFAEIVKFMNKKLTKDDEFAKKSAATGSGPVRIGRTKDAEVKSEHMGRVYDFKFYEDEVKKSEEKHKEGVVDLGLRKKLEQLKMNQRKLYDCLDMVRKNNLDLKLKYNFAKKEYQHLRKARN